MNNSSRTWVEIAVAVAVFAVGLLIGWVAKGPASAPADVPTIAFYDDWRLACPAATEKKGHCALGQDLIDSKSRSQVANLNVVQSDTGRVLVVTVPYNVLLGAGIGLAFGTDKPHVYPYTTCNPVGCVAQVPVDAATLTSLRGAPQGRLLFEELNKQVVQISFSLHGFKRADDAASRPKGGFLGMGA